MHICGIQVDSISTTQTLKKIKEFLNNHGQHYLVTVNPEFIVRAQKDKEFKDILNQADLCLADGIGIVWAAKLLGHPIKGRVTGVAVTKALIDDISEAEIFLLGSRHKAAEKIARDNNKIVGFSEELSEAIEKINQSKANVLLVALGAPKQEKWIKENLIKCPNIKVAMGVGGTFDFLAGQVKRAPKCLQKIGFEWLWRLILQPCRLPRIWKAVVVFPLLVLRSIFRPPPSFSPPSPREGGE